MACNLQQLLPSLQALARTPISPGGHCTARDAAGSANFRSSYPHGWPSAVAGDDLPCFRPAVRTRSGKGADEARHAPPNLWPKSWPKSYAFAFASSKSTDYRAQFVIRPGTLLSIEIISNFILFCARTKWAVPCRARPSQRGLQHRGPSNLGCEAVCPFTKPRGGAPRAAYNQPTLAACTSTDRPRSNRCVRARCRRSRREAMAMLSRFQSKPLAKACQ